MGAIFTAFPRLSAARYPVAKRNVMMRPDGALLNK